MWTTSGEDVQDDIGLQVRKIESARINRELNDFGFGYSKRREHQSGGSLASKAASMTCLAYQFPRKIISSLEIVFA